MPDEAAPKTLMPDPLESTRADSGPRIVPYTRACQTCRHFDCVCAVKSAHSEGCKYRAAATATIGIECDEHGEEICAVCHPCTCPDVTDEEDTVLEELDDDEEISVVMARPEPPQQFYPPTSGMLTDPIFGAILSVIRGWEITVPGTHRGHCIPTGEHARAILEAITPVVEAEYVKKGGD